MSRTLKEKIKWKYLDAANKNIQMNLIKKDKIGPDQFGV